ncbi:MAG TPA: thioredoxin-disulfide reductase [Dehalococcoidia bacterium]|nr:thioredoxin-disulfide reductase [Dehalococcoidia bacterium]
MSDHDLVIIGSGAAGLTAGLFAGRARLKTVILERENLGGQIANVEHIENFPGFSEGTSGYELGPTMMDQAQRVGCEVKILEEVSEIAVEGDLKVVRTDQGEYRAKAVIVAGGSKLARLGVPGEEEFEGRGVSYCATCDGAFFQDQVVAVVGGGDSACDEALYLTNIVERIIMIFDGDTLSAAKILQERVAESPKIELRSNSTVDAIEGEDGVARIQVRNVKTEAREEVAVQGVFVYVGLTPNTDYLSEMFDLDAGGHIPVNLWMETSVPGLFAAGDIRQHAARYLVTSAGDGATAAVAAERYIREKFPS